MKRGKKHSIRRWIAVAVLLGAVGPDRFAGDRERGRSFAGVFPQHSNRIRFSRKPLSFVSQRFQRRSRIRQGHSRNPPYSGNPRQIQRAGSARKGSMGFRQHVLAPGNTSPVRSRHCREYPKAGSGKRRRSNSDVVQQRPGFGHDGKGDEGRGPMGGFQPVEQRVSRTSSANTPRSCVPRR